MSDSEGEGRQYWEEGGPERLYVVTGARNRPTGRAPFDLVTLVTSRRSPKPGMHPEHAAILRMCTNPLSVAEISAYLSLPTSMVSVLVADLVDGAMVEIREPMSSAAVPDPALLEAVMDGLSKI